MYCYSATLPGQSCHLKPKGANWGHETKQAGEVYHNWVHTCGDWLSSIKMLSSEVSWQFHNSSADDLDCYAQPKSSKDNEVSSI